jgi:glycopeptide antibiotics resistance protein
MAIYVYVLFKVILFKFGPIEMTLLWQQFKISLRDPGRIAERIHDGNLVFFKEIARTVHSATSHGIVNLLGNIAIFVPFGLFLGLLSGSRKVSFIGAFLRSLGMSLLLEGLQALLSIGRFDVDDLILNTGGGVIGYMLYIALRTGLTPQNGKSQASRTAKSERTMKWSR